MINKKAPGEADLKWTYQSTNCTFRCDRSEIRLNNTKEFKGEVINGYYEYNLCNSNSTYYLRGNSTYQTLNILTILRHEIGHILGLDHFNTNMCNGSPEITSNSIMNSRMNADAPPKELSIYDKCAVALLHCPSVTPVEEAKIDDDQTSIFPNPSTDYIYINFNDLEGDSSPSYNSGSGSVKIYNTFGQCVSHLTPTLSKGEGVRIDVSQLPVGVYLVHVGNRVEKFVKW